ncbi:MAG: hypothetical protein R3Y07_06420 [Eubacteriales bacterium]
MTILDYVILAFMLMEGSNVCVLYFRPDLWPCNGTGVFNHFHESQQDEGTRLYSRYLISWIANVKMIFIVLLGVIVATGSDQTKLYACFAMVASISLYFVSLHPVIKKLDQMGHITPKGYPKLLLLMISGFLIMFCVAIGFYLV